MVILTVKSEYSKYMILNHHNNWGYIIHPFYLFLVFKNGCTFNKHTRLNHYIKLNHKHYIRLLLMLYHLPHQGVQLVFLDSKTYLSNVLEGNLR